MPVQELPRSSFSLYAELGVVLGAGCHVTGDIGVRSAAPDAARWQLVMGTGAVLAPEQRAIAPSVRIAAGAQCVAALTDRLDGQLSGGARAVPFPYEQMPPLPLALAPQPGKQDVTVAAGQHQSLTPGEYGALSADGSLTLAAGEYAFSGISLGVGASMDAAGPVRIAVLHGLRVANGARLRPAAEDLTAGGLVISVSGTDREGVAAVRLGERTELRALLIVPHATVAIGERADITGAVAGFRIDLGGHVRVRLQDGLPGVPVDAHGSQTMPSGYGVPAGPGTEPVAGPVPSDQHVGVCLGLPTSNGGQLREFLRQVSNPHSPQYRQFVSQEQFCAAYGASAEDYAELQAWADRAGLVTLGTVESNLLLSVGGTADQIQRALFVNLVLRQRPDGTTYPAADRALSVDVRPQLLYISGIGERQPRRALNADGSGVHGSYTGPDLRRAYLGTPNSLFHALTGAGQVIGIPDWAEYVDSDVDSYEASVRFNQGTPAVPQPPTIAVEIVEADSDSWFTPDPPNSRTEANLDVQLVYGMAPGAAIRFFKAGLNWGSNLDKCLHDMANFTPSLTVASCSLGFNRSPNAQSALDHLAAKGCSFLTASGDDGCTANPDTNLSMDGQTLVGGTVLYCKYIEPDVAPANYPTPYYDHEDAWTKSGGGVLSSFDWNGVIYPVDIPPYQMAIMETTASINGGSTQYRNYPDVAMAATGVAFVQGRWGSIGGTSCATPLFAGIIALANEYSQNNKGPGKQGFLNPVLYEIGLTAGQPDGADLYSQCFNDISDGTANTGSGGSFRAVVGYDLVTGLGSPKPQLILQLGSATPLSPSTPLTNIRFTITTGDDNLRDDSSALAYVFADDLEMFTLTLKPHNAPAWENWSVHQLDFAVPPDIGPLTETRGITGARIELVQGDGSWTDTADNWDIKALQVSLYSPGTTQVCQLNLVGDTKLQDGSHGLVRLSDTPGSHGSGPFSPIYLTGPGSGC
jgi:hypothetical protein